MEYEVIDPIPGKLVVYLYANGKQIDTKYDIPVYCHLKHDIWRAEIIKIKMKLLKHCKSAQFKSKLGILHVYDLSDKVYSLARMYNWDLQKMCKYL